MEKNKVLIISGATASGKTDLSIKLAKKFTQAHFEIVNFDSLLFYNDLNIGTAKPSREEQQTIKHHLIDIAKLSEEINASTFETLCRQKISEIHSEGHIPILTGGSTFYLRSFIKGMYESITPSPEIKKEIESNLAKYGIEFFIHFLEKNDPDALILFHKNDHYRITRAYEHFKMTGQPLSKERRNLDANLPYDFSINQHPNYVFEHICLNIPKKDHWPIMQKRASYMVENGLIDEVKNILALHGAHHKPLASIGYKETINYLNGEIPSTQELAELIYINTRKLAKSQKTFLAKITPKHNINPLTETEKTYKIIDNFLKDNG